MQLELDHFFVCVAPDAVEAEVLKAFGLTEGIRRVHQGQGTANVCFFFDNAYLELLWLNDIHEIQSYPVIPMGLWQRCCWRDTQACPFGIAFRLGNLAAKDLPFSSWDYYAPFLPDGASIPIATNSNYLSEPLIFISPGNQKPSSYPLERRPPLVHKAKLHQVTGLNVILPGEGDFSVEVTTVSQIGIVQFSRGDRYHLEVQFDCGKENKSQSFAPDIPISICW
jgi:Glyoxalase-like domain